MNGLTSIPLFSVLIPAYNAENTIVRCIESILRQGTDNYEVVVVDDGSTDNTYSILKKYDHKECFRIIHQENHGVSYTRQELIRNANGKYILFCDADDFFEPNAIKTVANLISKYDNSTSVRIALFIFGYNIVRSSGKKRVGCRRLENGVYNREQYSRQHIAGFNDLYYSVLWNKCFRRELIFSPNEILFERLIEDVMFNIDYMGRCDSICISDQVIYNYNQIGDSLTRSNRSDSRDDILNALDAYRVLQSKALNTYSDCAIAINQYICNRLYSLKKRAHGIQANNVETQINKCLRDYKKQLGVYYWSVKFNIILSEVKQGIRRLIKKR